MGKKVRYGDQTPTFELTLPYRLTLGREAVDLYKDAGRAPMPWQRDLVKALMATKNGHWVHTSAGFEVPRQNGKGEVLIIRELWGLKNGERILHTAHRTTTSHAAWERLCAVLDELHLPYKQYKAYGLERIWSDHFPGSISFRTRSAKGGIGESYDVLIVDEAQEYTDDEASALQYVVAAARNPQIIYCGTPPTAVSAGTLFAKRREAARRGELKAWLWREWSVDRKTDPYDVDAWYRTNPSLGYRLRERTVQTEAESDDIDFNIQRLGLWLTYNQQSAITQEDWDALRVDELPDISGKLHVGVKFAHDGKSVAMCIAAKCTDGRIFVEAIDDAPVSAGYGWILSFVASADIAEVVIDGQNGQNAVAELMADMRLRPPVLPTVVNVIDAATKFERLITDALICHMGQYSLAQSVCNCTHRPIGSKGGFGYNSLVEDIDVALLESAMLAVWSCAAEKPRRKQVISY